MKLYLLRPVKNLDPSDNPWDPWYDKSFGFIIRAESGEQARKIATDNSSDENRYHTPWLDEKYSSCVILTNEGEPGLIMEDFHAA